MIGITRNVVCRLTQRSNLVQKANFTYGLPSVPVPKSKKYLMGGIFMFFTTAPMLWMSANFKKYRGDEPW